MLLNSSHTHAAPWPGATIKLGGEFDDWTETELHYWDSVPDRYASAALEAVGRLAPARVSGGVGQAAGLAVNRRERTPDGRTILGWNREGVRDDSVVAIRVDGLDGPPLDTPMRSRRSSRSPAIRWSSVRTTRARARTSSGLSAMPSRTNCIDPVR